MSVWTATGFVVVASAKNRVRRMVERLREPRYLVGTAAAALYFYFYFYRFLFSQSFDPRLPGGRHHRVGPLHVEVFIECALLGLILLSLLWTWTFGSRELSLRFTEPEVQLLFPAPLTRRELLHYKLLRSLSATLLSSVVFVFALGRVLPGHPFRLWLGAFLTLGTLYLHRAACAMTRSRLTRASGWFWGLWVLAAWLGLGFGVVQAFGLAVPHLRSVAVADVEPAVRSLLGQALLWRALWPLRTLLQVGLAADFATAGQALPWALALFGAHYAWVVSIAVPFEDAAVAGAQRRAEVQEARRQGRRAPFSRAQRSLLPLGVPGRPEWGLTWKNLIAAQRSLGIRFPLVVVGLTSPLGIIAYGQQKAGLGGLAALGVGALALAGMLALVGPLMIRLDLRQDIPQLDILRAFPLSGASVVRAQMLGPALLLFALQAFLISVALVTTLGPVPGATGVAVLNWQAPLKLLLAASLVLGLPAVSLAVLLVQNVAALLFPAWIASTQGQPRGIEASGQRLLNLAGTTLVLAFAILPSALLGLLTYLALRALGLWASAVPLAILAGAVATYAEVYLGTALAGRLYDSLDLSQP